MDNPDYAIIGAGAAGCVLAARLSEKGARVLLIEAGSKGRSPLLRIPAAETLWIGNPRYDWGFETEPDPTLNNRRLKIPRGRILGGSNAINGTLFVRGQCNDFERWAQAGATGWDWDNVLPYFRKLEDWQGGGSELRGQGGPIRIEMVRQPEILCDTFIKAAIESGFPANPDYNSGNLEGFGYFQCTQRAGSRVSVVDGYLRGKPNANLEIKTNALVIGLCFEGKRCVGLSYRVGGENREISVNREVILSAGTVGSPQLLELSGIGNPSVLKRADIEVRHALPGVGENFQDHFAARLRWRILQRVSFNERLHGFNLVREFAKYILQKRGALSMPIAIGFGFVRSGPDELVPDLQFHFAPASYGAGAKRRLENRPGMTIGVYPLRPESRGSIHIRSNDPATAPAIFPNFLSAEKDLQRLIKGISIARRFVASTAFDKLRGEEITPGKDIQNDTDLVAHLRQSGDTSYHPIGTCRIGTDENSVVDPNLRVHGISGLRIVDASIMPEMVSGNTQAATMMIAEKAASMIL